MHQSPLVRTLQLFTQEEFETLYLFAASPIFNDVRPDETFALFEFLRRHYPDFASPELDREIVAQRFFPKVAKPIAALQRTMTQLMAIIRKFIAFRYAMVRDSQNDEQAASLHEIQQKLALMRFYSERLHQNPIKTPEKQPESDPEGSRKGRKMENFFSNLNNQVRQEMNKVTDFSHFSEYGFIDFQYFRFMVEQEKAFFDSTFNKREGDRHLLASTEQLDTFYLLIKLEQMAQLLHYQRMSALYEDGSPEHSRFVANIHHSLQIVRSLRKLGFLQDTGIAIYCAFLDFITQDDPLEADRLSDEFSALLEEHAHSLPATRVHDLKIMLRSFYPYRYRETKDKRFLEKIYAYQLQNITSLGEKDALPSSHFQSALSSALKLGKTEWAENFVEQFQNRIITLTEDQAELLIDIAKAAVLFAKGEFKQAAETLPHYLSYGGSEDIYLYAMAATLDIRIHYELDDLNDDYGHAMMHATSTRIRRDSLLPQNRKDERLRFFSIAKELYKIKEQLQLNRKANISAALAKVRDRLDKEVVVDWEWLEEKYEQLKQ